MTLARSTLIDTYPQRIVCLTEETTETLYLLGQDHRIAGISSYTVRPPRARLEKPIVCAFTTAKLDEIAALQPDLVLGFSDLQADIAAALAKLGIEVHLFNQRSIAGILQMIRTIGGMIGCEEQACMLAEQLQCGMTKVEERARSLGTRPRVYFEEWDEPMISGIGWVSELVGLAGGEDCFGELANESLAKDRVIDDPSEVVRRRPDIIVGSWCGKRFQPEAVAARCGWQAVPAVRDGQIFEIESSRILQPGPAALTDGVAELQRIFVAWDHGRRVPVTRSRADQPGTARKETANARWTLRDHGIDQD